MSVAPAEYTAKQLFTAEDLAQLPEDGTRHELVEGALIDMARPKYRHGRVQMKLGAIVANYIFTHHLGDAMSEAGFRLTRNPATVRGPDLAFVTVERALPFDEQDRFFDGASDLAVEIVSPNDGADEVLELIQQYLQAGTRLVWVIYSGFRLMIYRTDGSVAMLRVTDELDGEDVLPGFRAPVSALFD